MRLRLCLFVAVAALAASPARAEEAAKGEDTIRVMVVDLQARGVDAAVAQNLTELLTVALSASGRYSVADQADLKSLLTANAERQLLGCEDDKCFASIASVVGAQQVIHGSVGKVGDTYIMNVARIDLGKGTVMDRATESAGKPDDLIGKVPKLAIGLVASVPAAVAKPIVDGGTLEKLESHEQCVWAAVQYDKAKKTLPKAKRPKRYYVATFGSEHFALDEYDKLAEFLPLKADLSFLGRYPSCFGRENPYEDAFTVKEEKPLVLKIGSEAAYDLIKLKRRRKLVLVVEFEIVGAKLYPLKEYDWRSCDDGTAKFNPTDIAPNAYVRVRSAVVKDMFNHRKYAVTRQMWDPGTEKVTLASLPSPANADDDDEDADAGPTSSAGE